MIRDRITVLVACAVLSAGCAGENEGHGSGTQKLVHQNALSFNGISFNGISFNGISFNSLGQLDIESMGPAVMHYLVRCALPADETLVAQYKDGEQEHHGLFGLAPAWQTRGLDEIEARRLSACLLAHVNAFGVSVPISVRSPELVSADAAERASFPVYEGTFFGRVFHDAPQAYSCTGDDQVIAMALSPYRSQRVCTDPDSECAIVSLGNCRDVCDTYTPGYGWQGCWADGERYDETVSVYLAHAGDASVKSCTGDGSCALEARAVPAAVLDCEAAGTCQATCADGALCAIRGATSRALRAVARAAMVQVSVDKTLGAVVACTEGSDCTITGKGAHGLAVAVSTGSAAEVSCSDAGSCSVTCSAGSSCDIECTGGASCALTCDGEADCAVSACEGALTTCANGVVVCNQACPEL